MTVSMTGRIVERPYRGDSDFWRVRNLLIETYPLTPTGFNWDIRRWEGHRYHHGTPQPKPGWEDAIRLWETEEGKLVGAVHPEGEGDAYLNLHPDYRDIEVDMLIWAEENLAAPAADGHGRQLSLFVWEYDSPRQRLLARRGYEKTSDWGVVRRLRFGNRPLPRAEMAEGYSLRSTRPDDAGEYQSLADLLNAAFNRSFHQAVDLRNFMTMSPSFRHDLNLVAEGPDGSVVAHVGVTYDEANRRGIFEPVCTHPWHRRRGLARALMLEGMRRLKALGATDAYVDTGDMVPANALYEAVGFTEAYQGYYWRKAL